MFFVVMHAAQRGGGPGRLYGGTAVVYRYQTSLQQRGAGQIYPKLYCYFTGYAASGSVEFYLELERPVARPLPFVPAALVDSPSLWAGQLAETLIAPTK